MRPWQLRHPAASPWGAQGCILSGSTLLLLLRSDMFGNAS